MLPGFDPDSAARRLAAVVAAIQTFPAERQATVLREYLDSELGRLEAMEDAHQAYLGECVLLAVDNMQDARLQSVEDRLAALESPDGPSIGEMLTEAALVFAISLAALMAVEAVGGAVLLYFGQAATAPLARKAVEEADAALLATARTQVTALSQQEARMQLLQAQRRGLSTVLDALRGGSLSSALWQVGKALLNPIATARSIADALAKTFAISAELEAIHTQTLISHLAMAGGLEKSVAARVAYERALVGDAAKPDAVWRRFLDDAKGGLALAPAYSIFNNVWADVQSSGEPATGGPDPGRAPFVASGPAGRLLTLMRNNRLEVREEYAVLRAGLRYRTDDIFIADPLVVQLTGLVTELIPLRHAYLALQDTVRPLIVRGYEAALWWAYLQTNGMLGVDTDQPYQLLSRDLDVGAIRDGHVIRSTPPEPVSRQTAPVPSPAGPAFVTMYEYATDYYPGVPLLNEGQTEYLYETFAAPYFLITEHSAALPFAFDEKSYIGVRALSPRLYGGLIENSERTSRLDQMRVMVILFFRAMPELADPTSSGKLSALGEILGTPPSAAGWLALHPAATAPSASSPLADGTDVRAAQGNQEGLAALLSDSGVLGPVFYEGQRSELRNAIGELRNDIADLQALGRGDVMPGDSPRGLDDEGYARLIKVEQAELLTLYAQVLTAAQFNPEEAQRIETMYRDLVNRLSSFTSPPPTTRVTPSRWRFADPAPPAP